MAPRRGRERIVVAMALATALAGLVLVLAGCPGRPMALAIHVLVLAGLLLGLATTGLMIRRCAPGKPVPGSNAPGDGFGTA